MKATMNTHKSIYYNFFIIIPAVLLIFLVSGIVQPMSAKVPDVKGKKITTSMTVDKAKSKAKDEGPSINMAKLAKLLVYPESAKKAGKEGKVILNVKVSEKGLPFEVTVVKSSDKVFTQPAVDAMKKMNFKPLTRNGTPVEYEFKVPVNFRLK